MGRRGWWKRAVIALVGAGVCAAQPITRQVSPAAPTTLQVQRVPIEGGAELLVLIKESASSFRSDERGGPVPLVAVLRDTLGDNDPSNDRLRYVWSLTAARPSLWQRAVSGLPFFYWRVGGPHLSKKDPAPVLDLAQAHQPVVWRAGQALGQALLLDSQGMLVRSSTRAFRGNASDYQQAHLVRVLTAVAESEDDPAVRGSFTHDELQQMQARLMLAQQPFGGLVSDSKLADIYEKRRTETLIGRGRNWELLRQRSEAEGLLFEPLVEDDGSARFALVSVDAAGAPSDRPATHTFDRRFLNFSNPWNDQRLRSWKGFALKADSPWQAADAPPVDRIPLGLYNLDHPRVPLLVVDFRDARAQRRQEIAQRTISDVTTGVLRFTYLSNWYFFAGRSAYDFVRGRHGATRNRAARARAYEELRLSLLMEDRWDPTLRDEVRRRLVKNTLNPLDTGTRAELENAQHQYSLLLDAAADPHKLSARLAKDRALEAVLLVHGSQARSWLRVAHFASLGFYTHRETLTPVLLARLERHRRINSQRQFLQRTLAANPQLDVGTNPLLLESAVKALAEDDGDADAPELIANVYRRTTNAALRAQCLQSLRQLPQASARTELLSLYTPEPVETPEPAVADVPVGGSLEEE